MPPLLQFMHESESMICDLDFCMYGEQWKKPTRLLYKYLDISCLSRRCISNNNTCERTSRPHIPLQGRDAEGVFLTLRAQPYPWALANDFANVVARAFSWCGYGLVVMHPLKSAWSYIRVPGIEDECLPHDTSFETTFSPWAGSGRKRQLRVWQRGHSFYS